ncbi:MAG: hypothetical protein A2X48_03410 [Lentisphaerae bacterium GWF2_49_21]|nr:MAG: hypothetical protein A2X48_03410 [Lentisphaerae bacterium GWF2_49_21]
MKHRILFVEDDYITIDCAVTHLEISGHEVHVCEEIAIALSRLRYENFTMIFLDVMLPPGDQFSLTETVNGRYTGLRVLEKVFTDEHYKQARSASWFLITNWRDEPEVDAVAISHNIPILRKPLTIEQINEAISK